MKNLADFAVGDHVVRPSLGQIFNGERQVHVEPRSIDVLLALADRAGEVCPKRELIEAVWGAAFVSDEVLTHAIWDLRRAFGDDANKPRVIQTIPKRGYRLIALVRPLEPPSERASRRSPALYAAVGAMALAAVLLGVLRWRGDSLSEPPRADRLLLLVSPASSVPPGLGPRVYEDLLAEFAGAQGIDVIQADACEVMSTELPTLCLTLRLQPHGDLHQLRPRLLEAGTGKLAWAPAQPLLMTADPTATRRAAREVEELVRAYLRVVEMAAYSDPDIQPWFDFARHDTRAISDFLEGIDYVYTNQEGGRHAMDAAARRDPSFVAPRLWRIPTLVANGDDPERLERYLGELRRLYDRADPFERPMIQWAFALAENNLPRQLLELKIALDHQPSNRPVRFMLGYTRFLNGNLEGAWRELQPLADGHWHHPGLYSVTAGCAILLERLDDAREVLEHASSISPVDAETFELLELLALYRGDPAAAADYRSRKLARLNELDEEYLFDASPFAAKLADLALAEGREPIADALRESSG